MAFDMLKQATSSKWVSGDGTPRVATWGAHWCKHSGCGCCAVAIPLTSQATLHPHHEHGAYHIRAQTEFLPDNWLTLNHAQTLQKERLGRFVWWLHTRTCWVRVEKRASADTLTWEKWAVWHALQQQFSVSATHSQKCMNQRREVMSLQQLHTKKWCSIVDFIDEENKERFDSPDVLVELYGSKQGTQSNGFGLWRPLKLTIELTFDGFTELHEGFGYSGVLTDTSLSVSVLLCWSGSCSDPWSSVVFSPSITGTSWPL